MGMAVEPIPNMSFLLKFGLLKVADLIATKITWAWPKNKGDVAPYKAMDEFMKCLLVYSSKSSFFIMVADLYNLYALL
jgi:hypothetical protein